MKRIIRLSCAGELQLLVCVGGLAYREEREKWGGEQGAIKRSRGLYSYSSSMLRLAPRLKHVTRSSRTRTCSTTALSPYTSLRSALPAPTSSSRSLRQLSSSALAKFATPINLTNKMPLTASYPTPPTLPPKWIYTGDEITALADQAIKTTDDLLATIVGQQEKTFESVVRPLAIHNGETDKSVEPAVFMQYVSTDKAVRDAAVEADKKLQVGRRFPAPCARCWRTSAQANPLL